MHAFQPRREPRVGSWPCVHEGVLGLIAREPIPLRMAGLWSLLQPHVQGIELPIAEVKDALADLVYEGMIIVAEIPSAGDASYRVTEAGLARVQRWLSSPLRAPYIREELMMRLAVCGPCDLEALRELVIEEASARMTETVAAEFSPEEIVARVRMEMPLNEWPLTVKRLLFGAEMKRREADVEWLQHVQLVIKDMIESLREQEYPE